MPFNNNRKSRDDKSNNDNKKPFKKGFSDRTSSEKKFNNNFSNSSESQERSNKYEKGESFGDKRKSFGDRRENSGERRPFGDKRESFDNRRENSGERRSFGDKRESFNNRRENSGERRPFGDKRESFDNRKENSGERRSFGDKRESFNNRREKFGERRPFGDKRESFDNRRENSGERRSFGDKRESFDNRRENSGERRPFGDKRESFDNRRENSGERRSFGDKRESRSFSKDGFKKSYERKNEDNFSREKRTFSDEKQDTQVKLRSRKNAPSKKEPEEIRLNRYIANSGICSRRKADELIASGVITVNGEVVSELGAKVNPAVDKIKYNGEMLKREKMVYVLLNKPKDFITTTDDPLERKTVMELVDKASKERIYPVGRLDRNTTGLLLMTNDGDLAEKLSHPRNNITKIYNAELNKPLTQGDFNKIAFGLELEDGFIKPDSVSYVAGGSKKEIGIQIHSGKNRIVRRIFESLGYEVEKLDRVIYANLTKKDLPRGKWRFLTDQEVINLKHFIK